LKETLTMTRNTREPTKFLLKLNDHLFLMGDAQGADDHCSEGDTE
jgi:hypothetical protein